MTQFTEKYYAPILGKDVAEKLEKFATMVKNGRVKEEVDVVEVSRQIVNGIDVDLTTLTKSKQFSQATIDKRYEAALAKLNKKFGKGD